MELLWCLDSDLWSEKVKVTEVVEAMMGVVLLTWRVLAMKVR